MTSSPWITRRQRRWLSVWQIVSLLFMQLAVAAYVCPMAQAQVVSAAPAMAEMPGCHGRAGLDPAQAGLCKAHCQQGEQAVDGLHASAAADAPAAAAPLALLDWRIGSLGVQPPASRDARPERAAPAAPPPRYLSLLVLRQ